LLAEQDEHWKLHLEFSTSFLQKVPEPFDFVRHDSAHDYVNVKRDLETILPKMRKFGIICVHDTQQVDLYEGMLAAMRDATQDFSVSMTNLPFNCGLGIIRVESSPHPPIVPTCGTLPDGRCDTKPVAFATGPAGEQIKISGTRSRIEALRIKVWHVLRQAGLK
jgi:hypothetical protein